MSKFLLSLGLALGVALAAPMSRADASGSVTISFFYDELSPHGDWVTVGSYGHCWRPRGIDRDWQPYLNGEWVYTEDGWTWVSYDPWGGDPYHYGTWSLSNAYGWVWIPGTIWAPAWVTWYVGTNDIGWAPVPPSFSVGASGYFGPPVTVSRSSYVFVPATQFVGVNVGTVRAPMAQNATLLARTKPVTRFAASSGVLTSGGPTVVQVERATQRKIARVSVGDAHTKAVPLDAGLRGRRSNVIAPAAERAKFIASPSPLPAKVVHETAKAPPPSATVRREGRQKTVTHAQTGPAPVRVEPAKSQKAHARTADPAVLIAKPALPPQHAENHRPDSAPQQGAEAQPPKKEHGREKGD